RSSRRSGRPAESCRTISSTGASQARLCSAFSAGVGRWELGDSMAHLRSWQGKVTQMDEQIAVIADIHGNTWALDAVLEDIVERGVAQIVNLGDCVYGSLDPAGTLERLMGASILTIAGNQDRQVFDSSEAALSSRDYHFVHGAL